MKLHVGLWIDHRRAFIVHLEDGNARTQEVDSRLEKRVRASGGYRGSVPFGAEDVVDEDRIERKYEHHLEQYFEHVADLLGEPDALLLLGPAQAKNEFREYLIHTRRLPADTPIDVETADKLTDRQVLATVKKHFERNR